MRDLVKPCIRYRIGNGKFTSLWFDCWLPSGPICTNVNDRVIYDAGIGKEVSVSSIIREGQWRWPVANSPQLLELKESIPSDMRPNVSRPDTVVWVPAANGIFSVRSAWQKIRFHYDRVDWHHLVWFKKSVPRHSILLWLAMQHRLSTQDKLKEWGVIHSTSCVFCRGRDEDHNHLFFQCSYSLRIWTWLQCMCGFQCNERTWAEIVGWCNVNFKRDSLRNLICKLGMGAAVYVIWRERNARSFDNIYKDVVSTIKEIKSLVRCWLYSCAIQKKEENKHLLQVWHINPSSFMADKGF